MDFAPIVLFVYNRPWHTKKTLQALRLNELASKCTLFIFSDGSKNNNLDREKVNEVREVIRSVDWCKKVVIKESIENKGLADSIVEGVTSVIKEFGKAIILEDDIVTSPMFLTYMNNALNYYEKEEKVMHISGYMPPIKNIRDSFFFYNQTSCWGWATWQRAWSNYNKDAKFLKEEILKQDRGNEFDIDNSYPFLSHLEANITGDMRTWAVKWHASVFILKGLCLHPNVSYTQNIGMDGSGINCNTTEKYSIDALNKNDFLPVKELEQNMKVFKKMVDYNLKSTRTKKRNFLFNIYFRTKDLLSKA